jgi:hypothetical protein
MLQRKKQGYKLVVDVCLLWSSCCVLCYKLFFYFVRMNVSEHVGKKIKLFYNNENILPVAHQFEEVFFKVVFVIFFLILELKSM